MDAGKVPIVGEDELARERGEHTRRAKLRRDTRGDVTKRAPNRWQPAVDQRVEDLGSLHLPFGRLGGLADEVGWGRMGAAPGGAGLMSGYWARKLRDTLGGISASFREGSESASSGSYAIELRLPEAKIVHPPQESPIQTPSHAMPWPSHAMPCHVIPFHAMPYHAMLCYTTPYYAIPYCGIPYRTMPPHAIPCHTVPYQAIPCHTKPYHAMLCYTMQNRGIPYRGIPYRTMPPHAIQCHTVPYHVMPCHTKQHPSTRHRTISWHAAQSQPSPHTTAACPWLLGPWLAACQPAQERRYTVAWTRTLFFWVP